MNPIKDRVSDPAIYAVPSQTTIIQKHVKEAPIDLLAVLQALTEAATRTWGEHREKFKAYRKAVSDGDTAKMNQAFEELWKVLQSEPGFVMSAMLGILDHYLHFLWYFETRPKTPETKAAVSEWACSMAASWAGGQPPNPNRPEGHPVMRYLVKPGKHNRLYRGRFRIAGSPVVHDVALDTRVKEVALVRLKQKHEDAEREAAGLIPPKATRDALRRPLMELFEEFLMNLRKGGRSADYLESLKARFPAMLRFCGWKTLADITPKSFLDWRNSSHGYAIRTQNHFFDSVRVLLSWVETVYDVPHPLKKIRKLEVPKMSSHGPRAFTEDELARLYAAAPRRQLFYRFVACTGLRHKETRRLRWTDVNLDGDRPYMLLRAEATKARREDRLPLLPQLVPDLRKARPVWAKPDTRLFHRGVPNIHTLHRDLGRADIPLVDGYGRKAGFHTFRRTFITMLQKRGVASRVIMQLARHKSLNFTDFVYTDATQLPLKEGLDTLGSLGLPPNVPTMFVSRPASRKFGPNGIFSAHAGNGQKAAPAHAPVQVVEIDANTTLLAKADSNCPNSEMVGELGLEPRTSCV